MTEADRRALALAALTAAVTTLATKLVDWGIEAAKKRLAPMPEQAK